MEGKDLLPLEGVTSAVWKYQQKMVNSLKFIRKRGHVKVLKYSGNTTNLRFHLEHNYRKEFIVVQQPQSSSSPSTSAKYNRQGQTQLSRSSAIGGTNWQQLSLTSLQKICSLWIQSMIHEFDPWYTPPDRKTIASTYLPLTCGLQEQTIVHRIDCCEQWFYFAKPPSWDQGISWLSYSW